MKIAVIILLLVPLALADDVKEKYVQWMKKHKRAFVSKKHASESFKNFQKTDAKIEANNAVAPTDDNKFMMGHNHMSDWSDEQFNKMLVNFAKLETPVSRSGSTPIRAPDNFVPGELDLRTDSIPVKNQGQCGSCWAFSAIATIEYDFVCRYHYYLPMSEQNCVDCAKPNGCQGGFMCLCLDWYKKYGLDLETNWPYRQTDNDCHAQRGDMHVSYAPDWYTIPGDETLMAYIMQTEERWVSACLDAAPFAYYQGFDIIRAESGCSQQPNHAIVLVGFGTCPETGVKYWIVRNSWGIDWGNGGYCRIQRDASACGLANPYEGYRTYPAKS